MFNNTDRMIEKARSSPPLKLAVAAAADRKVLEGVMRARGEDIIDPLLVGDEAEIEKCLEKMNYDPSELEIVPAGTDREAADKAIELVQKGEADFPMKGMLKTDLILHSLLKDEYGLKKDRLISLVTMMELEEERMILMSDPGMNIDPDLGEKIEIMKNAVEVAHSLGIETPKVALLAAVESVSNRMPATEDAAVISKMCERGQLGECVVDGPLALDNIISPRAAAQKKIDSEVAGSADIIIVPYIEVGNVLYKAMITYAGVRSASIVTGAEVPVVVTSRADTFETRFNSIALAKLVLEGQTV